MGRAMGVASDTARSAAEAIRVLALANRVSQTSLATAAGIERATVSRYLTGRRDMPLSVFVAFCDALGVEPGSLLVPGESPASSGGTREQPVLAADDTDTAGTHVRLVGARN